MSPRTFLTAALMLVVMTILTGFLYPLGVTAVAAILFPRQATGSILERDGQPVGSDLIGQSFDDPRYFWGRPTAIAPVPYNAMSGSGSNQATTNPALTDAVKDRVARLKDADPANTQPIPVELVTASGSGLDPHLSPAGALYQAGRVARVRGVPEEKVRSIMQSLVEKPTFGVLGQPRVNILRLNLALDASFPAKS